MAVLQEFSSSMGRLLLADDCHKAIILLVNVKINDLDQCCISAAAGKNPCNFRWDMV